MTVEHICRGERTEISDEKGRRKYNVNIYCRGSSGSQFDFNRRTVTACLNARHLLLVLDCLDKRTNLI
jgi:hypothetical protein